MEDPPLIFRFVVLTLLLAVNSFFSAAEVALVTVRHTRMRQLADGGNAAAGMALGLIQTPERMLSAVQLGVTLASLGLGWAGEETVFRVLAPVLVHVIPPGWEAAGRFLSFGLSFSAITYLHMVLGEVVPKNLAIERSERLALLVAPPLEIFARATHPFISLVEGSAAKLSRLLGLRLRSGEEGYTAEELKLVVSVSKKEGEHAQRQEEMLHRVIDFYDLSVREVMAPRHEMVALPIDAGLDQVIDCVARKRHSRIPIYEGSPENVVGVLYAKELWSFIQQMRRWQLLDRPPPAFVTRSFIHDVAFVPETKMLYDFLEECQSRHVNLAMVVDEFGTVSGLVTVEDALEQIVGEIREEHERARILSTPGETVELDGATNIRDLGTQYAIELPYDAGFETLAGFLLSRFGHIPDAGESLIHEGRRFTVLRVDRNRIARVRIERPDSSEAKPA